MLRKKALDTIEGLKWVKVTKGHEVQVYEMGIFQISSSANESN